MELCAGYLLALCVVLQNIFFLTMNGEFKNVWYHVACGWKRVKSYTLEKHSGLLTIWIHAEIAVLE